MFPRLLPSFLVFFRTRVLLIVMIVVRFLLVPLVFACTYFLVIFMIYQCLFVLLMFTAVLYGVSAGVHRFVICVLFLFFVAAFLSRFALLVYGGFAEFHDAVCMLFWLI